MQVLQQRGRQLQALSMLVQTELLRLRLHSARGHQGQDAPPEGHLPEVLDLVVLLERLLPQVPQVPDVPQVLHLLSDVASVLQRERPIRGLPTSVRLGLRVRRMQVGHHLPLVLLLPLRRDRRPQPRRQVRAQAHPRPKLRQEALRVLPQLRLRRALGSREAHQAHRSAQGGDHGVSDAGETHPRYVLHPYETRHRIDGPRGK